MIYTIQYYLDCLQQFESILPGVIKSNFVWAGCDEEVSIPGMGPTKYFLVVIFKLRYKNISKHALKVSRLDELTSLLL